MPHKTHVQGGQVSVLLVAKPCGLALCGENCGKVTPVPGQAVPGLDRWVRCLGRAAAGHCTAVARKTPLDDLRAKPLRDG